MARPFKTGLDYFNIDCVVDDKIKIVEAEHKVVGFYVWVKLLQRVYANSYWLEWDRKTIIVFSNEINVDINSVNDVINSCLEWDVFSKKVFDAYSVLTSHGIQKRYFEATKKRKRFEIIKEYMLFDFKPSSDQEIVNVDINPVNSYQSTQSKVKESKVTYSEDSIEFRLSSYLMKNIRKNLPEFKTPDLQKWSETFGIIIRNDCKDVEELKALIQYVQSEPFFIPNILSPTKLHKRFNEIKLRYNQRNKGNGKNKELDVFK